MVPVKDSKPNDDEFFRALIFPEEDRALFTTAQWNGGHRWFRSPNVVCIEKYSRPTQSNSIRPFRRRCRFSASSMTKPARTPPTDMRVRFYLPRFAVHRLANDRWPPAGTIRASTGRLTWVTARPSMPIARITALDTGARSPARGP